MHSGPALPIIPITMVKRTNRKATEAGTASGARELFGQIALRKGFITEEQLQAALARQKQIVANGEKHRLIGLVMLELGTLSNAQLIEILKYIESRRGDHHE